MKHKIDNITMYWFSGSGNSLIIAIEAQEYFTKQGINVRLLPLEKTDPSTIDTKTTIGFVIPVAGQSTYPFIWEFIERLPETNQTPCFLIDTLAMYSGGILGPVKRILRKKGYTPGAAIEIKMPNIFQITKSIPEKEKKCIEKGKIKTREFCEKVLKGNGAWLDIPLYSRLLGFFYRNRKMVAITKKMFPYTIDSTKCNGCGICITLCPEKSLTMSTGEKIPVRSPGCSLCHRCFSFCPRGAIQIGNKKAIPYRALPLKTIVAYLNKK